MPEDITPGESESASECERRSVLKSALATGVVGATSTVGGLYGASGSAVAKPKSRGTHWSKDRLKRALDLRESLAAANLDGNQTPGPGEHPTNGDENRYDEYVASFTKGLPHDVDGEVSPVENYEALVDALDSPAGEGAFDEVELGGSRKLITPASAGSFPLTGLDSNDCTMAAPPAFRSDEMAAETVELYWRALLRDLPFREYGENHRARRAASELDSLAGYTGPTSNGSVTTDVLFRGNAAGAREGPFVSQFLYKDIPRGNVVEEQSLVPYEPGVDYATAYDHWLAIQNGDVPGDSDDGDALGVGVEVGPGGAGVGVSLSDGSQKTGRSRNDGDERYITTGRDLATYVHGNTPDQSFRAAALICFGAGVPLDDGNPLVGDAVQTPFVDYGPADVVGAVGTVVRPALLAAWHHKWRVHRKLRPETFGGRIHNHLTGGATYADISDDVLDSTAVAETENEHGSYLLPQAYPEGSPTHPSYPAGHAVIAGACATVVKAYFDDEAAVPDPVAPDPLKQDQELRSIDADLTVAGEVNKLASNDSLGRDFAGIHYRSDAAWDDGDGLGGGLLLGERVAHGWLRDRLTACARSGTLTYTTISGDRVTITPR